MNHIKEALAQSPILSKLKKQLSQGGGRDEIMALLSEAQKSEVYAVHYNKGVYTVKLKSAYAIYGVKDALRNFHHPVKVVIFRG